MVEVAKGHGRVVISNLRIRIAGYRDRPTTRIIKRLARISVAIEHGVSIPGEFLPGDFVSGVVLGARFVPLYRPNGAWR